MSSHGAPKNTIGNPITDGYNSGHGVTFSSEEHAFLITLKKGHRLSGCDQEEINRMSALMDDMEGTLDRNEPTAIRRRLEILELYFSPDSPTLRDQRRREDRYISRAVGDKDNLLHMLSELSFLYPELAPVTYERVGGVLLIKAKEHVSAVLDDFEELSDSSEIDMLAIEHKLKHEGTVSRVTFRGVVRAINVLLDRVGVRERLLPLRSDHKRESYIALGVAEAIEIAREDWLGEQEAEAILNLGGW